ASRPTNVLLPVAETSPSASKVEMLVATTRSRSSNPAEMFTGERGLAPSFAEITVSIPPASVRKVGEVAWPKKLPSNPATDFAVVQTDDLTVQT
ncbi:esterase, partial [Mesorhizobium sp. M00.F.Ca.ET.158.01.1.1]